MQGGIHCMKKRNDFKSIVSIVLTIVLILSAIPVAPLAPVMIASAAPAAKQTAAQTTAVQADWDPAEVYRSNQRMYEANARTEKYLLDHCLRPGEEIESDDRKIIAQAKEITAGISNNYEKAKAIHDWVCNNIWYDYDWLDEKYILHDLLVDVELLAEESTAVGDELSYRRSAIGTLETGRGVCAGYATLTTALLRAAGIPAKYVYGGVNFSDDKHAWTEAYVDNRWIILDTTWDSGNKWKNGGKTASSGLTGHRYFDPSLADFSKDHSIEPNQNCYSPFIGTLIEDGTLIYCGDRGENLSGVKAINRNAFYGNTLINDVVIPEGVKSIPDGAFRGCSALKSVALPKTVRTIGKYAFAYCNVLKTITMQDGVTEIGVGAFSRNDSLRDITLPNSVRELGDYAFIECKSLKSIQLSESLSKIGQLAFKQCESLESISLPASLREIKQFTFAECTALKSVNISDGVEIIDSYAFNLCSSLESVTIPASVREYGLSIFLECDSLKSAHFSNGLTNINSIMMFYKCPQFSEMVIPPSVTEISYAAFDTDGTALTVYGVPGSVAEEIVNACVRMYSLKGYYDASIAGAPEALAFVPLSAQPTASRVLVNGESVAFDAYSIIGNNYFKLRDLAYVLSGTSKQFSVGWNERANAISLESGEPYTPAGGEMQSGGWGNRAPVPGGSKILLNGKPVNLTAYTIDGSNYFKLRDLGQAFDFNVGWNERENTITIETNRGY